MIRRLTHHDLPAADAMLRAAFGAEHTLAVRLERYLAIEPEGWLVDEVDGRVRGTVGAVVYGPLAYVGLMAVEPALQGRGVGRALFEDLLRWLEARGVRCAILDATEAGAPLYDQLGFVDAGVSRELTAARRGDGAEVRTRALAPADEAAIRELDAALYGARRDRVWDRLFVECRGRIFVHRAGGALVGYLCALPEALGPWGARDDHAARALLDEAAAAGAHLRALVPGDNPAALRLLQGAGFEERRTLRHMRRGPAELDWRGIYGKASYCLG